MNKIYKALKPHMNIILLPYVLILLTLTLYDETYMLSIFCVICTYYIYNLGIKLETQYYNKYRFKYLWTFTIIFILSTILYITFSHPVVIKHLGLDIPTIAPTVNQKTLPFSGKEYYTIHISFLIYFFYHAFMPAIIEEYIFRKVPLDIIYKYIATNKLGKQSGIMLMFIIVLFSSMLFGICHIYQGNIRFFITLFIAIQYCCIYIITDRSIYINIMLHMLTNGIIIYNIFYQ